ncbi:RHS protein [Pseudomonas sp. TAA207]|nr:RHS protein [Pseudomonas sp. TAA207]
MKTTPSASTTPTTRWDGDTLAWESSPAQADGAAGKTVHYLYEPGTFVPVAQAMRHQPIRLLAQPNYESAYDIDQDPLWTHTPQALPIDVLTWYQCDHLGTPQELTDPNGQLAWSAQYKAWGEIKEQRSKWAQREGLKIRSDFRASTTITKRGCTTTAIGTMIHGSGGLSAKTRSAMPVG